jgi:microcystin-dependent protein
MARTQIKTPGIADGSITTVKLDSSIVGALVPIGGIIMWSGTTVPSSWALCNGSNGTPDLRNRFIVAADSLTKTGITTQFGISPYDPGDVGGSADATLVSHSHTATSTVNEGLGHSHGMTIQYDQSGGSGFAKPFPGGNRYPTTGADWVDNNTTGITVATSISVEGSVATNKNLPPYYALAFIMRTS